MILIGAGFLVFAAWLTAGWGGEKVLQRVSDGGALLFGAAAVVSTAAAARRHRGRQRQAWSVLTVGLICWVIGDAIWAYEELVVDTDLAPFPSLADAGYLLFPVAACVSLTLFPVGYAGQYRIRALFDGVIVAGSLFVLSWSTGLDQLVSASAEPVSSFGVSIAYPLTDLVMLTTAVLVLTRARVGHRAPFVLLAAGMSAIAVADSAFVYLMADDEYSSAHPVNTGYAAGMLLLAVAGLVSRDVLPDERRPAQVPPWLALWLPYVPLPIALVVGVAYTVNGRHSLPVLIVGVLLITTVLIRQFLVLAENRRLLAEVAHQALRDPLTGLANRALFLDRLRHAVGLQLRDGRRVAVLSLDLDDFKLVNDSLGHAAGDSLLQSVAVRLIGCVREEDTIARLGGDEFAILLEAGSESPRAVAERICAVFQTPFLLDGLSWTMQPSVGVAAGPYPTGSTPESTHEAAETLLKNADLAMYAAKRSETGLQEFTPDMRLIDRDEVDPARLRKAVDVARVSPSGELFAQLRRAIEHGELTLVYQPKFSLSTGQITGVEALVRWPHPHRGLLLPNNFLPVARDNGLMGALTDLVLTRAADDAARWSADGRQISFAVNLFPPSLTDPDLVPGILQVLHQRGLPGGLLTVEITEEIRLNNLSRTRGVLKQLQDNAVRIALDDFGSGYSSLSYLGELGVDELKLDRAFVAPVLHSPSAQVIVRSAITMAHSLGMTCVAEGVEDAETTRLLGIYGCDMIQGNYCSPPVSAADVPLLPAIDLVGAALPTPHRVR